MAVWQPLSPEPHPPNPYTCCKPPRHDQPTTIQAPPPNHAKTPNTPPFDSYLPPHKDPYHTIHQYQHTLKHRPIIIHANTPFWVTPGFFSGYHRKSKQIQDNYKNRFKIRVTTWFRDSIVSDRYTIWGVPPSTKPSLTPDHRNKHSYNHLPHKPTVVKSM